MSKRIDDRGFKVFYLTSYRVVVGTILEIINDSFVAEDLAHEIFFRLYKRQNVMDYNSEGMRKYLYRAARNISIDYIKQQKRGELLEEKIKYSYQYSEEDRVYDAESIYLRSELSTTVGDIISNFSDIQKRIFRERFLKSKRLYELARDLDMSYYKVRKMEKEIRAKLQEKLGAFSDCKLF